MGKIIDRAAYWDGDDLIIVVKKPDRDLAAKVLAAIDIVAIAPPASVKPMPEAESKTPNVKELPLILSDGKYAGLTPEDALAKDKDHAYAYLKNNPVSDPVADETIQGALKAYFRKRFGGAKTPAEIAGGFTVKQCKAFFKTFALSDAQQAKVCKDRGFETFAAFLETATEKQLKMVVAAAIQSGLA